MNGADLEAKAIHRASSCRLGKTGIAIEAVQIPADSVAASKAAHELLESPKWATRCEICEVLEDSSVLAVFNPSCATRCICPSHCANNKAITRAMMVLILVTLAVNG